MSERSEPEGARHTTFTERFTVNLRSRAADVVSEFEALLVRLPTDRITAASPAAIEIREEPPLFLAVTFGAALGLGIIGHILAETLHTPRLAPHLLALGFDIAAIGAVIRLGRGLVWRAQFAASQGRFVIREWLWRVCVRDVSLDADDVTALLVVGESGRARIVAVGARNVELAEIHRERWMDPRTLQRWLANAVALVVSYAGARDTSTIPGESASRPSDESVLDSKVLRRGREVK